MRSKVNKPTPRYSDFPKLMADCELSGAELARRVDVFPSTVSTWMTGKSEPPGAVIAYLELLAWVRSGPGVLRGKK